MSLRSKTDPLLAKAKHISLWDRIFKKGKSNCSQRQSPEDTKISEEGEGGGAPGTRAEIPLQPMEIHGGAEIHLQPMENHMREQMDVQRRL
ncbi:protein pxr1-like [Willisornis vidua]|uniref:Protein pxr1-like n=1 Tax=Willisornis vidua TaxID=1566151 RepID=A0ABQ9DD23_9PASS|nr:protein pxr1-like [Willisornis vidua]